MKDTPAAYPIHPLVAKRWSPRAFSSLPVEPGKLLILFEAARWAPSSFNEQPWHFVYAEKTNPPAYDKLLDCLVEGNQAWARTAPVLMVSVAKLYFEKNGKPNRHAFHDVGLAVGNMALQAASLDLYIHQMAGIDLEKARKNLLIPEGYEAVAGIAVGYLGDPSALPEMLAAKELEPRKRRDSKSFVFEGQWRKNQQA